MHIYSFASVYWRFLTSQLILPSLKSFRKDLKTVFDGFPIWSAISARLKGFPDVSSNETINLSILPIMDHQPTSFLFHICCFPDKLSVCERDIIFMLTSLKSLTRLLRKTYRHSSIACLAFFCEFFVPFHRCVEVHDFFQVRFEICWGYD